MGQTNITRMKKILIIDGGARKTYNLAAMFESFKEGVKCVIPDAEIEHVHLYDLNYHGCCSCMACKLAGGENVGRCAQQDDLSAVLESARTADGIAFGSPAYFSNVTGQLRSAMERLLFPWLSYKSFQVENPNRVPTATIYTMNATPEHSELYGQDAAFDSFENMIVLGWTKPERVCAYNTCQVKDYSRYDFMEGLAEAKEKWRNENFEADRKKAFDAGIHMAEKIILG